MSQHIADLVQGVREGHPTDALFDALEEAGALTKPLLVAIGEGYYDHQLDAIAEMVRIRRQALATSLGASLRVGDRVQIVRGISPKYLIGRTAVVVSGAVGTLIQVQLDQSAGRFSSTRAFGCPVSCLRRI